VVTQSSNSNFPTSRTLTGAGCSGSGSGSGSGDCPAHLTAHPVCCGLETVPSVCRPNNPGPQRLAFTGRITGRPNLAGVAGTLQWYAAGTGPCPNFPSGGGPKQDYWHGAAPTNSPGQYLVLQLACFFRAGAYQWGLFVKCENNPLDCFNDLTPY